MYLFDFKSCELINKETLDIFTIDEEGGKILYNYLIEKEINVNTNELIKSLLENDIEIDKITLWDRNSFAPQTPIVHIIQNCNSPCTMCDCWKTKNSIFHTAESLDSVFRKLSNLGATSIMISGGEPLLHKELDTIIDKVHGYHMAVQLNSNGILLDKRASLYNKNIEALVVSMEGFNRDDYKTIRGTDKFELVCDNIKNFKSYSPNTVVGLRVTLTKHFFKHVDKLINLCRDIGVDSVGFSPLDVTSNSFSRTMNSQRSVSLEKELLPDLIFIEDTLADFKQEKGKLFYTIGKACNDNLFYWTMENFITCLTHYTNFNIKS